MEAIKQDMPPPGGFSSVHYERVPLKKPWPSPVKWVLSFAIMGVGWWGYYMDKKRITYEAIEKRAASFSILPLIVAENDRLRLKHFAKLRDEEADLMKNVEGWKVGTYYGEPIYKTLKPNEWYEPDTLELWLHSDLKSFKFVQTLQMTH